MSILVASASRHGATTRVADAVAAELATTGRAVERCELGADREAIGHRGEPRDGLHLDVAYLDARALVARAVATSVEAVVLGGAVYTGSWLSVAFDAQQRLLAAGVPIHTFSVGVVGMTQDPLDPRWLAPRTATSAGERVIFGGAIDRSLLSLRERSLLAVVRAEEGEYTRWEDVRAWARALPLGVAADRSA